MYLLLLILLFTGAAIAQDTNHPVTTPELGPNLPAQPIGANDLLSIYVYDAPEFCRTARVSFDGFIRLPMLKQRIKVSNQYPEEVEGAIAKALQEEDILVEPFVTVTIAEYHSRPINVSGAVKMPLVFQAEGPTTLLEAIARAQGLREDAGTEVVVSSPTGTPDNDQPAALIRRISIHDLIDKADPSVNLTLTGGEEVRIPEMSKVYVVGNVKKPGAFPLQGGGSDTTILEMIALAEGLDSYSSKMAYICRKEDTGAKREIPVELSKIMERKSPDVPLMANDILYIPDNRGKRISIKTLQSIVEFGTTAGATALIYGRYR
jgi:polysaccharide export outer membrane protein